MCEYLAIEKRRLFTAAAVKQLDGW
eukprot:COSAG02_NODE_67209_length_253_cov_1.000000_1_plen_24_part_10